MPRPVFDAVHVNPAGTITGATELVAVTSNGINTSGPGSRVFVRGYFNATCGTVGTTLTIRVRRGTSITGTLVGQADVFTIVASTLNQMAILAVDSPGEVSGQQYVITVQQGAGAGNGTLNDAGIETTAE